MPTDFEEKYLLLRDENTALKKKKNEQEATIKRMFTKLAMIEEALKKKRQSEESDNQQDPDTGGKATIPVKRDLDTERFINALKNENLALRKKTQALQEKNRVLEETIRQFKLKPHLVRSAQALAQSSASTGPTGGLKSRSSGATTNKKPGAPQQQQLKQQQQNSQSSANARGFAGATLDAQVESARKLHRDALSSDLEHALKSRLVVAEKQLVKLQRENERLRRESGVAAQSRNKSNNHGDDHDDAGSSSDERGETQHRRTSEIEVEHLKRELRDRQAQLAILNARYDNLEANAAAEREIQEKTLEQMEAMNRQVHKLRTQLQDATMEREHLEAKAARARELEKEIALVREQNHRLEERMTALCESPFINDAFQRKERIDKLFELERTCEQQKSMLSHLGDENQKLQVINKELQSNLKLLKQAKDAIDQDMARVRQHLAEERNARSVAAVRAATEVPASIVVREAPPRPAPVSVSTTPAAPAPEKRDACSSPVRIDRAPLEQPPPHATSSHLVMSRRYDSHALTVPPFIEGDESDTSVKHLRNRVHVLQMAHLRAMQELERCEKMLHAQTNINRELALEIEELTARKVSASSALQSKIKELALVAEERQQRIHELEAHVRQLKYARAKLRQTAQFFDPEPANSSSSDDDDRDGASDVESVSESLVLAARDLAPGEQLLELVIISATFDRSAVSSTSSTFVLCDFYDFESQTTPLVMGTRAEYSFSATFRVTVDAFFLRYLASETLVLEVHQAQRGDFKLVGRALVRLSSLLRSRGVLREHALPVKAVLAPSTSDGADGKVLGTLNVVLRLSCPISEIWRLHLRSYPQDIQLLERERTARAPAATADGELVAPSTTNDGTDNEASDGDGATHRVNELQVAVLGCRNLRSYGKKKASDARLSRIPSSYVHYQLLGFPDAFTNIVAESAAPEYDLACSKQSYVLELDACLLRFFSKFRLWLTVFDDQVELDGGGDDGMIGRCGILLSDLADCKPIRGWFALRDRSDEPAGEISVAIQWKTPFDVLSILGYELIDVEKESSRANGGRASVPPALPTGERSDARASETTAAPQVAAPVDKNKPVNLDVEILTDSNVPPKSMAATRAAHRSVPSTEQRAEPQVPSAALPVATPESAASEFQRRKDAFMERMKAIASASSKSLVYEELERKQMQQRLDIAAAAALRPAPSVSAVAAPPPIDALAQQIQRLQAPQAIHHSAAKTVQHTYRQYRAARVESEQTQRSASILNADLQLQRLFQKWSSRELDGLERQLLRKIEAAAAGATKARSIARKQLSFIFTQTPQVALDPALLSQLLAHFAVAPTNPKSLVAHHALVHFLCSVSTAERVEAHDAQHAVVPIVKSLCLSIPYARATFESVGDMKRTGAISLKRFRDALERLGVKLPAKDVRMLVVLFDSNGAEVLYRAFLHMVERWSPASQRLAHAIQRCCDAVGLPTLREKLVMHVPSEDGAMTEQDLHAVLTRESSDSARFDSQDARVLFQMMTSESSPDTRVAIHDFIVRLERSGTHSARLEEDASGSYSMKQLRRLASNCRKLTCGSYSELVAEFERFDWREDGVVPLDVFVAVASTHGFYSLTTLQLKQIAKCFGAKRDGRFAINYRQFLDWTTPSPGIEIAEIEAKLRAFAHAQAERVGGKQVTQVLADWRRAFVAADQRHGGYLTRAEFLSVAKTALHVPLSDDELRVLLYSYDRSLDDQVDYDAFVQLNWSETSRAKQVRFEQPSASASELVQKIRTAFASGSESGTVLLESLRDAADERSPWIDERAFTLCLKRLGVLLSPADVRALFAAFGEPPDRNKLDYDAFVRKTLGLAVAKARVEHELAPADAARLRTALSTAVETSRDKVVAALQTLQEHCVVHRFGDVAPQVFWRLMDASGVVALVSRRATGLLAQKFLVTYCSTRSRSATSEDEKESDDERISLRAVYSYLHEVVQQQSSSSPTKKPLAASQSTAPGESDRSDGASALAALRRLLTACHDTGVDVRGEFEKLDATYSGVVTAMELKQVVLGLGMSKFVARDAAPEAAIGQLVRQFRVSDARDAVAYTTMLRHAHEPSQSRSPELEWVVAATEHLRARIRRKAGLSGKLSGDTHELCARLDACFAHFDRSHKGFVTLDALHEGLAALQYDLTRPQVQQLIARIGAFRTGAATLSRMEFDAFVLDPDAALALERLARDLAVVDTSRSGDAFPRIAQVSRALLARDSSANAGVVPAQTFWPSLEDALDRKLSQLTKRSLALLFDVRRDAHVAYRLFLKVVSQWQKDVASADDSTAVSAAASPVPTSRTAAATGPACSRRDVLEALYHQLSSLDFDAQVAIVHEHLRRTDASGSIAALDLMRVFRQIGIALSSTAEASLLTHFAAPSPAAARVEYDALFDALQELHDGETRAHEDAEPTRAARRK